jgi:hypothetical protein
LTCGKGAPTAPPTLAPTPGEPATPSPTPYGVWYAADASTAFGAAGGDTIVFTGSGFNAGGSTKEQRKRYRDLYQCVFVAISGDETSADSMSSAPATAESETSVTCITPAWGSEFVSSQVTNGSRINNLFSTQKLFILFSTVTFF